MNQYLKDPCELWRFRAVARVEETFPKYEMLSAHADKTKSDTMNAFVNSLSL